LDFIFHRILPQLSAIYLGLSRHSFSDGGSSVDAELSETIMEINNLGGCVDLASVWANAICPLCTLGTLCTPLSPAPLPAAIFQRTKRVSAT
jgi:hypothetical protein